MFRILIILFIFGFACSAHAQWIQYDTLSVPLDFIDCIAVDSGGMVYATSLGSVYRSGDQGEHWVACAPSSEPIVSLSVAPDNSLIISEGDNQNPFPTGNVYRSTDSAKKWNLFSQVYTSVVQFDHSGGIYLGLLYTTNLGATWNHPGAQKLGLVYAMTVSPQGTFVVFGDSGMFRSTNQGKTWGFSSVGAQLGSLAQKQDPRFTKLLTIDDRIFISDYADGYFYCSMDDGKTFHSLAVGPVGSREIIAGLSNHNLFMARDSSLFHSMDGGEHWQLLNQFPENINVITISGETLFIGTDRKYGIYRMRLK